MLVCILVSWFLLYLRFASLLYCLLVCNYSLTYSLSSLFSLIITVLLLAFFPSDFFENLVRCERAFLFLYLHSLLKLSCCFITFLRFASMHLRVFLHFLFCFIIHKYSSDFPGYSLAFLVACTLAICLYAFLVSQLLTYMYLLFAYLFSSFLNW